VNITLNYEQTARLELVALFAGKSTAQLLTEAAEQLLRRDAADSAQPAPAEPQKFLSEAEMAARFAQLLRR
jgi:hypothetical protein